MELNVINTNNNGNDTAVVVVRDAYKKYDTKNIVLNGLNMTVAENTIYGLLGPSGCGKTTLLNCVLGRIRLDYGEIKLKVRSPANIGYLPQETALYKELNILEIMVFYGRIFGLSYHEINKRTDEWLEFLDLPSKSSIIDQLSGGQKRRVSFAIALLHDPQLLILDEPTAGVDPLLCERIWNKLEYMVENENKTVIITTHYIEETRKAHTIGLMRNGKLLAEESPSQLMTHYNSSSLEDIFLQLSQKQHSDILGENHESKKFYDEINYNIETYPKSKDKPQMPMQQNLKCSGAVLFALMTKTCYWMRRNKVVMFFVLLQPILNTWIFTSCIGNDPLNLKMAVVNEELPEIAQCKTLPSEGCNFSIPLSCRYLKKLQQKTYQLTGYDDLDAGKNAVRTHQAWGLLHFPKNYTDSINERIALQNKVDNSSSKFSQVQIWLDMSDQIIGNLVKKDVLVGYVEFFRELFSNCGWPSEIVDIPLQIQKPIYGDDKFQMRQSVSSAAVASFQFYLPMSFTLESILMERKTGSLDRSLVSGVTILEISIAHMIVQLLTLSVQSTAMMTILYVFYDNPILVEHLLSIILVMLLTGVCSMFYGFLLAVISNVEQIALFLAIGSTYGLFILIGVIWPTEAMHWLVRPFAEMLPATQSAKALQALAVRDNEITDAVVYNGILSNIGASFALILITFIIIKKREGFGIK